MGVRGLLTSLQGLGGSLFSSILGEPPDLKDSMPTVQIYPTVMYHPSGHVVPRVSDPMIESDLTMRGYSREHPGAGVELSCGPMRVSPQDFGAKGDGTTDDTAALQAWAASDAPCDPSEEPTGRKCSNCGEAGHTKRTCPKG